MFLVNEVEPFFIGFGNAFPATGGLGVEILSRARKKTRDQAYVEAVTELVVIFVLSSLLTDGRQPGRLLEECRDL